MQTVKVPDWFKRDLEKARWQDRNARIAAMPRVKVLCGKDWAMGPWCYSFGVMWDKNPDPPECEWIYRRRWVLTLTFHISFQH